MLPSGVRRRLAVRRRPAAPSPQPPLLPLRGGSICSLYFYTFLCIFLYDSIYFSLSLSLYIYIYVFLYNFIYFNTLLLGCVAGVIPSGGVLSLGQVPESVPAVGKALSKWYRRLQNDHPKNIAPLPMNKWVPEQPSPWRKSWERESCYGDQVYGIIMSASPPSPRSSDLWGEGGRES